jgi:uncharacterized protein DUF3891
VPEAWGLPIAMIVRDLGATLELITQPGHAHLAGDLLEAWQSDGLPARRTRSTLLFATREHDRGWERIDETPLIDPSTGRPYDFVAAPDPIKQQLWPQAVASLGRESPYAAALVAQHGLTVYSHMRPLAEWDVFFATLTRDCDAWLSASRESRAQLESDYRLLRLADLISLAFCNGWTEPREHDGYRLILAGETVTITPDPFGGARVRLRVSRRTVPNRSYASTEDLLGALRGGRAPDLTGIARGTHD